MTAKEKTKITVEASINAPVETVWNLWTDPKHIIHWNNASDDWHTPDAENDLRAGGRFRMRMEAKDGSMGFDFTGVYERIDPHKLIEYTMDDGRTARISFTEKGNQTMVTETFEAEEMNSVELQRDGWQAILNNFRKYAEASDKMGKMHFEISIETSIEKVYKAMIDEKHYAEWTTEFNPTSHFKGSWEKGAKIIFLGTDQDGSVGGMVSRIKENIPNKFISIEHLGIIQNGKEIMSGSEIEGWAGATENYSFNEIGGKTLLSVDMDANEQFKSYFEETWPKALNKLKAICEQSL